MIVQEMLLAQYDNVTSNGANLYFAGPSGPWGSAGATRIQAVFTDGSTYVNSGAKKFELFADANYTEKLGEWAVEIDTSLSASYPLALNVISGPSVTLVADQAYYARLSTGVVKPSPSGTAFFLGDSNTVNVGTGFAATFPNYINAGVNGATAAYIADNAATLLGSSDPAIIGVQVGANDLANTAAQITTDIESMVAGIRNLRANAFIVLTGVFPVSDVEKVAEVNAAIASTADLFIDVTGELLATSGSMDPPHLTATGRGIWLAALASAFPSEPSPPPPPPPPPPAVVGSVLVNNVAVATLHQGDVLRVEL